MLWVYKNFEGNFDFIRSNNKPNDDAQLVDALLWAEPIQYLVASETLVTDDQGNESARYDVVLDLGLKADGEAQKDAALAKRAAAEQLYKDIFADALSTANTSDIFTAIIDVFTYIRMEEKPELFAVQGLVAKNDSTSFAKGDALDTVNKIQTYAQEKLSERDSFMIRRWKMITDAISQEGGQ